MSNEIGENRVLFFVFGVREEKTTRERLQSVVLGLVWDVLFVCVNMKLREDHTCENEMGIGKVNHTTFEFALFFLYY
jgi:hypothetical protein